MADAATVQEELLDLYRDEVGIKRFHSSYSWPNALAALPDILRKGVNRIPSGSIRIEHEESPELYSGEGGSVAIIFELVGKSGETQYFRNDGYMSSWDGPDWQDTLYEVRRAPKQTYDYKRI